jgi:hypothetical protein
MEHVQLAFAALGLIIVAYKIFRLVEASVVPKLKDMFKKDSANADSAVLKIARVQAALHEISDTQNLELNYIKGQLQTIQQEIMALKFAATHNQIDPIYLESLAALSKASQTTLERQAKIENLLLTLVGKLKDLTNS